MAMGHADSVVAGTYTVSANFSPSQTFNNILVCEYSGLVASSAEDTSLNSSGTGTLSLVSGAFTTANANDLVVYAARIAGNTIFTAGLIAGNTATLRFGSVANDDAMEDIKFTTTQSSVAAAMTIGISPAYGSTVGAFKLQ